MSLFKVEGDPLQGDNWREITLGRYSVPQNAEPIDLDSDGDLDLLTDDSAWPILFRNDGAGRRGESQALRELGVTRLSLGVENFDPEAN